MQVVKCSSVLFNFYSNSQITSEKIVILGNALNLFLQQSETEGEQELWQLAGQGPWWGSDRALRALQNKQSAEALPAQPLPGASGISSQAELVYYGINAM